LQSAAIHWVSRKQSNNVYKALGVFVCISLWITNF